MPEMKRLLAPVDFSETSEHALGYARDLTTKLGAELHLVHVYQLPMYSMPDGGVLAGPDVAARIMDNSQRLLEELAERVRVPGAEIHTHLGEGMAHSEILRVAAEIGADLIVMGTHGRSGLSHVLLGSVAERLVRTSDTPVLTVRHREGETS